MKLNVIFLIFAFACLVAVYTAVQAEIELAYTVPIIMGIAVVCAGLYMKSRSIKKKHEPAPRKPETYYPPSNPVRRENVDFEEGARRTARRDEFMRGVEERFNRESDE